MTVSKYTLDELEAWRDWARYFQYKNPAVYVYAAKESGEVILSIDWSDYFRDMCGERVPYREDMAAMAADLAEYVNERRNRIAKRN